MSEYKWAQGHDNTAGLLAVTPQPMSPGLMYPRQIFAASGDVYDDGEPFTQWVYSILTPTQYLALLAALALDSARTALITVQTLTDPGRATWSTYNARIVRPMNGEDAKFERGFWRDVVFLLRNLEATE